MLIFRKNGVAILTTLNGEENRTSYANSENGRAAIAAEQMPKIVAEVMAVWGDTPTVPDYIPEPPINPTFTQQITTLKQQLKATDYQIIKCSECQLVGQPMPYDVAVLHAERQALRDQINVLEMKS